MPLTQFIKDKVDCRARIALLFFVSSLVLIHYYPFLPSIIAIIIGATSGMPGNYKDKESANAK